MTERHHLKDYDNLRSYIKKVGHYLSHEINDEATQIINGIVSAVGHSIVSKAHLAVDSSNKKTIGLSEISTGVHLTLGGQLLKHAQKEIEKVVKHVKNEGKGSKHNHKSGAVKGHLMFSPARVEEMFLRSDACKSRVSEISKFALAAVLEYITAEIVDLAGHQSDKHKRINKRDVYIIINNDSELYRMVKDCNIKF